MMNSYFDETKFMEKMEEIKHNPPYRLEADILSYVSDIEEVISIADDDQLKTKELRYRGLNSVLGRMQDANQSCLQEVERINSESNHLADYEFGRRLAEGGISGATLAEALPQIRALLERTGEMEIGGKSLSVSSWWQTSDRYGICPAMLVLDYLVLLVNEEVGHYQELFRRVGHEVKGVTSNHLAERQKRSVQAEQMHEHQPVYSVTGIRHHMGKNMSMEERTAAAERFLQGLEKGRQVALAAEPDNSFDPKAIAVYLDYQLIGYIAREETDEVRPFLDEKGQCDAVVERDDHVTLFITIPSAQGKHLPPAPHQRQLPDNPLGKEVRMPFSDEERRLQLIALRMVETAPSEATRQQFVEMAERYVPLQMLSVCSEDQQWRTNIMKKLEWMALWPSLTPEEKAKIDSLYSQVLAGVADMRSTTRDSAARLFVAHLERLRANEHCTRPLYERYCIARLDGKEFGKADPALVEQEHSRLTKWLKGLRWKELRDRSDLMAMGKKVKNLGLTRDELYDLYSVLLVLEQLEAAAPQAAAPQQEEQPNYAAPTISLQQLLRGTWFEEVRAGRQYDAAWTDTFVDSLMASEHRDHIAREWSNGGKFNKCLQIKGHIVGLLKKCGVLKGSDKAIATQVGLMDKPESFCRYMGAGKKTLYACWVMDYVKEHSESIS